MSIRSIDLQTIIPKTPEVQKAKSVEMENPKNNNIINLQAGQNEINRSFKKVKQVDKAYEIKIDTQKRDKDNTNDKESLKLYKKKDLIVVNGSIKSKRIDDRPVYKECIDVGSETTFTLTIDESKFKQDLGIKNIDSLMEALSLRINLLFGDNGIISAWEHSSNYLPENVFDKGVLQIGGGVGFHSKTLISSISSNREEANKLTGKILDKIFKGKKHFLDKPISPRALKVATVNNQDVFMGFCKIKEIN